MGKRLPTPLMALPLLLLGGCSAFDTVSDLVIEPYKSEMYKPVGEGRVVVNGVPVTSNLWPRQNVMYASRGPFAVSISFQGMRDSDKVVAIKSIEVTSDQATLFTQDFDSLRSGYFERDSSGANGHSKEIGGVWVTANASLDFGFGKFLQIEHRPGQVVTVRVVVDVSDSGINETKKLVFRHRAKTNRGVWRLYPGA